MDASAGCSAGSLVGGFMASGVDLDSWIKILSGIDSRTFWTPDSVFRIFRELVANKGRGYTGFSTTQAAMNFTRSTLAVETFKQCAYPFHALAVNLGTGKKVVFSSGELAQRMTASAAIPILYEPVEIKGEYYCDGALIDFAPTDAICCRHKLDVVIVHHVSQTFGEDGDIDAALKGRWAMLEVLNRLIFRDKPWYLRDESLSFYRCPCGCGAVIIVIVPDLPNMSWRSVSGGDMVQYSAKEQTENLLRPWLEQIKHDPRKNLPRSVETLAQPDSGCGIE